MADIDYTQEISFWESHLQQRDRYKTHLRNLLNPKKRKLIFPKIILKNLKLILGEKNKVKVLDVGCGPTSILAWAVDKKYFEVKGIDPLANEYRKMMKKNNYDYPIVL